MPKKGVEKIRARDLTNQELFYGHKACAGCGESLAVRLALKVLGEQTIAVVPPNCISSTGFIFPQISFTCNAVIAPFAATGAMQSGIEAGLRALGEKDFYVVGFSGDGGTADIGIQALSGAIDRGDRIIYICLDNEAYMNTGIQKSSLTPYGTHTTTSPAGKNLPGSTTMKKNMFEIVAAHDIHYAATASIGYPMDYINKVNKAKKINGTSYIHVLTPCPTGWGVPTNITVELGKKAVDCGLWYLAEFEQGEFFLNKNPKKFLPVKDYLSHQRRYRHLKEEDIAFISRIRDKKWEKMRNNWRNRQVPAS